jgi:amphi-Trp domain-containing protein
MPATKSRKKSRDVERAVARDEFIDALRRLADGLEAEKAFVIRVRGERVRVPVKAEASIEHEREGGDEELEFQLKWRKK